MAGNVVDFTSAAHCLAHAYNVHALVSLQCAASDVNLTVLMLPGEYYIPEATLNARRHLSAVSALRWHIVLPCVAVLLVVSGCGEPGGPPPPEGQLAIENVAKWYSLYRADNRGTPPKDEDTFVAFIDSKLKERGDTVDREQLLTSPRDGQKFVVTYGKPTSNDMERNVAVHEKEGYGGNRLVAYESGWSEEVDEATLQSLLAGK